METDWKALAALTTQHLGNTVMNLMGAVIIGLLVAFALILLFWKLGVFRRPVNTWYNLGVKLYIPYLMVSCLIIAVQCGFYRAVYKSLLSVNDAVVGMLYAKALGPALGSPEARQAFLIKVQEAGRQGQTMGQAITATIKEALHSDLTGNSSLSDRLAAAVADRLIDHYENDIATAVLYGIYLKSNDQLHLHAAGGTLSYHAFKEGTDHLLQLDLTKVETAVQDNLGALTHGLITRLYRSTLTSALLLGALLVLLPVLEWGIYLIVMRRRQKAPGVEHSPPAPA